MTAVRQISRAHDGARILWRFFQSPNDRFALEGHVREFNPKGDHVKIARTTFKDDRGAWLRVADLMLIDVLEEKVALTERPKPERKPRKPRRVEGDEWKDGDETGELGIGGGDDE